MECDIISVLGVRKSVVICPRLTRRCELEEKFLETMKL